MKAHMKNTAYKINADLTASLTDENYLLTVCSERLDDYDTYKLVDGEWELAHDSLSNRSDDAANIWDCPEFAAWANEMKNLAEKSE